MCVGGGGGGGRGGDLANIQKYHPNTAEFVDFRSIVMTVACVQEPRQGPLIPCLRTTYTVFKDHLSIVMTVE